MFFRRPCPHFLSTSGLTRTELLFLLALAFVLAVIAVGPMRWEIQAGRIARGVESARLLNTLLSQYATDNGGSYPVGEGTPAEGRSEGIALNLLQNQFTPNADIFAVGSTPRYAGTDKDYADLAPENISWDFTAGATTTTGITAAASDLLPIVYTTGESIDYAGASGHGLYLIASGKGPYGEKGIVAAYKDGSATFIPPEPGKGFVARMFIRPEFKDTGTYTQIKP